MHGNGMHGWGHVAGGYAWLKGGIHDWGVHGWGMHDSKGHAWLGRVTCIDRDRACMDGAGGTCGRVCMAWGMCGWAPPPPPRTVGKQGYTSHWNAVSLNNFY